MIIECISCSKKFEVNADLIPSEGRNIQCGSCNHLWFYKKNDLFKIETSEISQDDEIKEDKTEYLETPDDLSTFEKEHLEKPKTNTKNIKAEKSNFNLNKLPAYLLVLIISFGALIIIIDTFKSPLYQSFPELELVMYNFYETLKDISLFIKDLI